MAYYMCPTCFNVYDSSYLKRYDEDYLCPNLFCDNEELFDIDELMITPIQVLNKKGYQTRFCCSGHIFSNPLHSYIMFNKVYDFKDAPKDWKKYNTASLIPYNDDDDDLGCWSSVTIIENTQYDTEDLTTQEKHKIISERIANLLKWVYSLPKYKENKEDKESEANINE